MNTKITTTDVIRNRKHMGWKVYLNGKKYPGKPLVFYAVKHEAEALQKAYIEAGLDPAELKDIVME